MTFNILVTILIFTVILNVVIMYAIFFDIRNNHSEKFKELSDTSVLFNPFKQMDLFYFLVSRKYLEKNQRFHKYDIFIINLSIIIISSAICMYIGPK